MQATGWDRCPSTWSAFLLVREVAAYVEPYCPLRPMTYRLKHRRGYALTVFLSYRQETNIYLMAPSMMLSGPPIKCL